MTRSASDASTPPRARAWLSLSITPGLLLGGLGVSHLLTRAGMSPALSVTLVVLGAGLILWALEWIHPHTVSWRPSRGAFWLDVLHSLVSAGLTSRLVEVTLLAGAAALAGTLSESGAAFWPVHWALVPQLVLALLLGELGAYTSHRICHRTAIGWRVHAVHHTPELLHWLASGRTHPLNTVWVFTCQSILVVILGAPAEVLSLMAVFTGINGFLQHANVRMRPGILNAVVSTSDLHRWHHAKHGPEGGVNFGNNLSVWDHVFRTYYNPKHASHGDVMGIANATVPERFGAHLATPFVLGRFEHETLPDPSR